MSVPGRLYTIAPGRPFLDQLATGVLAERPDDPLALTETTILLPTRRGCRSLREAFLRQSERPALLLPAMRPLGEVEDDDFAFDAPVDAALPPAISSRRRQLLLTRLIHARGEKRTTDEPLTADQAARLAQALARLIDQVETERLSFDGLADLVPEDYAAHWQITLDFLAIVTEHWPAILAEEGALDPAARRNALLDGLTRRWRESPPDTPVIAAGSTGTVPATADLLEVVAQLPKGVVILPGLDRDLDDATWQTLEPSHPQFGLKRLLDRLDVGRDAVIDWPEIGEAAPPPGRVRLISEAMRPLPRPALDEASVADFRDGVAGLLRIDCPGPREEAAVIALLLREALEVSGKRAALVTIDRDLARRVGVELGRFGIAIDDSAGRSLGATPPGVFLRLTAELTASRAAPIPLLAALKHPLAALGTSPAAFRSQVRRLERAILRGPRPGPGFTGLTDALARTQGEIGLSRWLANLAAAAEPFEDLVRKERVDLEALLCGHLEFAEALAASDEDSGSERLWAGDAGEVAALLFAELIDGAPGTAPLRGTDYPALLDALMAGEVVRPAYGGQSRLFIWGPLEARLQHVDRMILSGLNEAGWPAEPEADPWMSHPMRKAFGLAPLERRIGLSAHDFAQCFCAPEVVLTRARKHEGTPSVPSRWLTRLDIVLDAIGARAEISEDASLWLAWQDKLDVPETIAPMPPPAPRPALALRPRQLSVTAVETWMRDPYAIYARHILKLRPLDPIDAEPGAAERGSFIHRALNLFLSSHRERLPSDARAQLLACGRGAFGGALERPGVEAFWWPRFVRIAEWFLAQERMRRETIATLATEADGRLVIEAPGGEFLLTARADRIDRQTDGRLAIIDYKTGTPPHATLVARGLSPQLPLEAAIALAGGFEGLPAAAVAELAFWRLSGGEPTGEIYPIDADAARLAADALDGLGTLVARFDDPETPYLARPRPETPPAGDDYDHLARIGEWLTRSGGGTP